MILCTRHKFVLSITTVQSFVQDSAGARTSTNVVMIVCPRDPKWPHFFAAENVRCFRRHDVISITIVTYVRVGVVLADDDLGGVTV